MSTWTRHFYDRDCVADALHSALLHKHPLRKQQVLFWTHELVVSEEWDLLFHTLTRAFLHFPPFPSLFDAWKQYSSQIQNEDAILDLLRHLLRPVACLTLSETPVAAATVQTIDPDRRRKVVNEAFQKQNANRLFVLLGSLDCSAILQHLPGIATSANPILLSAWKSNGGKGFPVLLKSAGLSWWISPDSEFLTPSGSGSLSWPKRELGSLSARLFRTPRRKHPMDLSGLGILTGCAVWSRILQESGVDIQKSQETGMFVLTASVESAEDVEVAEVTEKFYATYFPDDIPDEWTAEERAKSHL